MQADKPRANLAAMNAPAMVGPLHIDGGEEDIHRFAASFGSGQKVAAVGRRAQQLELATERVSGRVTSMGLHFGMQMLVNQLHGHVALELPVIHGPAPLEFSFCRGQGVQASTCDGTVIDMGSSRFRVTRIAAATHFRFRAEADAKEQSVHVSLTPATLQQLLGSAELPLPLQSLLSSAQPFASCGRSLSHEMFELTDAIFEMTGASDWGTSAGKALALEGKVLELIGLAVDGLDAAVEEATFSTAELRALAMARELISSRPEAPPSVQELAQRVGLGEKRLKSGFKAAFGSPVMSFARRLRLERARSLLASRRYNVTEVAHLVGYANASKFSAAYRREFGENPGSVRVGSAP